MYLPQFQNLEIDRINSLPVHSASIYQSTQKCTLTKKKEDKNTSILDIKFI